MLEIQTLKQEDRETSFRLSQYSFGYWSDGPVSEETLDAFDVNNTLGGYENGQLVSKVSVWPFQQSVRGVMKPMGGLAGVVTDPLHRKKGYVSQVIAKSFEKMRDDGQVVSSLYPFLETFYEKFGYVKSNEYVWLKYPTKNLMHYLPYTEHSDEWTLEKHIANDAQDAYQSFMHRVAPRHHGYVVSNQFPDYIWKNYRAKDQFILLLKQNGRSVGLLRYKISGNMHGGEMTINDIFWMSIAARNRLFGYIAMHEVNLPTTAMAIPMGVNFQQWFQNPTQNPESIIDYVCMMCRVIDPIGAITDLPAANNGRFLFNYQDPQCPWTDATYEMVAENGRLHLQKTNQTTPNSLTPKSLSALVFGTLSTEELMYQGWCNTLSEDDVNLLDSWFPTQLVFNSNKF